VNTLSFALLETAIFAFIGYSAVVASKMLDRNSNTDEYDNDKKTPNKTTNQSNQPIPSIDISRKSNRYRKYHYARAKYPQETLAVIMVLIVHKLRKL
jgi:hypothetical protein